MAFEDLLNYSPEARVRVAHGGQAKLSEFVSGIPRRSLDRWLRSRPPIRGFSNARQKGLDEQRRQWILKLVSDKSGKEESDWLLLRVVWLHFTNVNLADTELPNEMQKLEDREIDLAEGDPYASLESALTDISKSQAVSRELLLQFLTYSPFPNIEPYLRIVEKVPTSDELSRKRIVDDLPNRIAALESELKAVADRSARRVEDKSAQTLSSLAAQVNELTQLASSLPGQLASLSVRVDEAANQSALFRQSSSDLESRLRLVEGTVDGFGKTIRRGSYNELLELPERVTLMLERLESIEEAISARDVTRNPNQTEGIGIGFWQTEIGAAGDPVVDVGTFCDRLASNFGSVGVLKEDRDIIAREVAAALLLGQQISFAGSMNGFLLTAAIRTIGGRWTHCTIPVGLFDDIQILEVTRRSRDAGGRIALLGANRSAFEVYGDEFRRNSQPTNLHGKLTILALLAEGSGSLPVMPGYAELGPIIDSDSLKWRIVENEQSDESSRVDLDAVRSSATRSGSSPLSDEDIRPTVTQMDLFLSSQQHRNIYRAATLLSSLWKEDAERQTVQSILASWFLPYAKASGVSRKDVRKALASGVFADCLTISRTDRLLAKWDVR